MRVDENSFSCSAASTEILWRTSAEGLWGEEEMARPHSEQAEASAGRTAQGAEPWLDGASAPNQDEPPSVVPTLPGGGLHEVGDPGVEGAGDAAMDSTDRVGVEKGLAGDAQNSAAQPKHDGHREWLLLHQSLLKLRRLNGNLLHHHSLFVLSSVMVTSLKCSKRAKQMRRQRGSEPTCRR